MSIFTITAGLVLTIAMFTVGWQTTSVAIANPVDSLMNE